MSTKPTAVMDIECYRDYFLVMFKRVDTGAVRAYELFDGQQMDTGELRTVMGAYRIVYTINPEMEARWAPSFAAARDLLQEAGVQIEGFAP